MALAGMPRRRGRQGKTPAEAGVPLPTTPLQSHTGAVEPPDIWLHESLRGHGEQVKMKRFTGRWRQLAGR